MKKISTISRLLTAALLLLLVTTSAFSQGRVSAYAVTTPNLGWSDISSTGSLVYNGELHYGSYTTVNLPFAFVYDNTTESLGTTLYVSGGWLSFQGLPTYVNYGGVGSSSYPGVLGFFGGPYMVEGTSDYYGGYAPVDYGVYTQVTGTSGNQVFTIQLVNCHSQGGAGAESLNTMTSIQVKLYQKTGVIQFIYHDHGKNICGYDYYPQGIGINGFSSPSFKFLTYETGSYSTPSTDLVFTPPAPPGEYSLQPKSLNYGGVSTGQTLTLNDTLTSLGPSPITLVSATISGSANYTFAATSTGPTTPGAVLNPLTKYIYQIQFTPTAAGNLNALFTVVTTSADSVTQSCVLNGSGLAPQVQYTFPYNGVYPINTLFHHVARRFGDSATTYFYIKNVGTGPLQINSITFYGLQASMYTVFHTPQNPLPVGVTDSIGVKFKPFLEGRPDAHLVVNTNSLNNAIDTIDMWGTGILAHLVVTPQVGTIGDGTSAAIMQFDSVAMGDSVCQTLTLHSTGTDTLIIKKQIITYGDYDFTFSLLSGSDLILPPDASKTVNICFKPLEQGLRFASVRFYTNIPVEYPSNVDSSQFLVQVSGTGVPFGHLALTGVTQDSAMLGVSNCIDDTIWNNGSAPLTVNSATVSGLSASDFTLGGFIPKTIVPAKGYIPVTLCFKTANRGAEQDTLIVMASSNEMNMTQVLAVTGVGQQACASAAPNPVSFPLTLAGTMSADSCITVTNCGDVAEMFTATLGAGTSTAYALTQATTAMVAPGGTSTICLHFSPDTIGAMAGTIIVTPSVDGATNAKTLTLSATGGGAWIAPSGQPAATAAGSSSTFTVTLTNSGNWPWTPGTGTITGANAADYSVTTQVTPTTIAAGGTGTMTIKFAPATMGTSTAQLAFASESPVSFGPNLPYPLSGTVTAFQSVAEHTAQDGFVLGASYPNPTNGTASAFVTLPYDAKVRVTVMNLDGSVAAVAFDGMMNQGDHTIALDAKQLASGTYFYQLESGAVRLTRAMIVTH